MPATAYGRRYGVFLVYGCFVTADLDVLDVRKLRDAYDHTANPCM